MIRSMRYSLMAVMLAPAIASAQMVAPAPEAVPDVCPNRPSNPAIIENMGVKDAHLTLLLQGMYKAVAYQNIVETGSCRCDQRFPSWEPVVQYYLEHYAGQDDHNTVRERRSYYRQSSSANRPQVRDLCIAAGNW